MNNTKHNIENENSIEENGYRNYTINTPFGIYAVRKNNYQY